VDGKGGFVALGGVGTLERLAAAVEAASSVVGDLVGGVAP